MSSMDNNVNDSKKNWRNKHDVWPNKKSHCFKTTIIDQDRKTEIDQKDTADYINKFFTGIQSHLMQILRIIDI